MKNIKSGWILGTVLALLILLSVASVFFIDSPEENNTVLYQEFFDFTNANIGSQTGTIFDQYIEKIIDDPVFKYYDDISGEILALKEGHVDALGLDEPTAKLAAIENADLAVFPKVIQTDTYGYALPKGSELTDEFSAIIAKYREDGTLDRLAEKWFSGDPEKMRMNMEAYTNYDTSHGTINFFHDSTQVPMAYVDSNGVSSGYEVELLYMIAKELGKKVVVKQVNFSSLITAVSTGKADASAGCISITDERRKSVDFPDTHYVGGIVLLCRSVDIGMETNSSGEGDPTFLDKVSQGFYRTFVKESRYKMILSGLGVTVLISLLALFFGSILGFGICLLRRDHNPYVSKMAATVIRIIQGTPLVVLLMFLYYVVFASAGLSGIVVAVIAFSLNFAVNSGEIMRSGIDSIGKSQWDVSRSLGLSRAQTFSKVIMPQAIVRFMPAYKSEFINMMKMTSIVGFIAVSDLTKASDIIRSHTYDALFPLFTIAILYFLLAWILTEFIGLLEFCMNQKRKPLYEPADGDFCEQPTVLPSDSSYIGREIIRIEHLKKSYGSVMPLKDINVSVSGGEIVSIIGPSGTGKTTLLKMINRYEMPAEGKVYVFGKDISKKEECDAVQKKIGMLFQVYDLFPHLSAIENVMLAPMCVLKKSREEACAIAEGLLKSVSMIEKKDAMPHELSGGQKQRIAIAQALAMNPEIILFDEPTSALDPTMVSEILSVIRTLSRRNLTVLVVTHELRFARAVSTRVLYLDEGIVYESGTPEDIFDHPKKEKTRRFVQKLRTFEATITSRNFDFIGLNSGLELFGRKHLLPKKTIYNLQTLFEELCVLLIMPKLSESPCIELVTEYSEENENVRMMIRYNGNPFDPLAECDEIQQRLIRNASQSISYKYISEEENGNAISILVK